MKSGFTELDKITHGWCNGDLIVIGSRAAMGKTAFGISLLKNIAVKGKIPTAFFSLESSNKQIIGRSISALSQIEIDKIYNYQNGNIADLSEEELYRIEDAKKQERYF